MTALEDFTNLAADAAMSEAKNLQEKFELLINGKSTDSTQVFLAFAFMNWTFAAGVWSNISNTRLRRDLNMELKDALVLKIAKELAEGTSAQAAKAIHVADAFNKYMVDYNTKMKALGEMDSRLATLFALERIQGASGLSETAMDAVVAILIPAEGLAVEMESIATKVNEEMARKSRKGFLGRLFGG